MRNRELYTDPVSQKMRVTSQCFYICWFMFQHNYDMYAGHNKTRFFNHSKNKTIKQRLNTFSTVLGVLLEMYITV